MNPNTQEKIKNWKIELEEKIDKENEDERIQTSSINNFWKLLLKENKLLNSKYRLSLEDANILKNNKSSLTLYDKFIRYKYNDSTYANKFVIDIIYDLNSQRLILFMLELKNYHYSGSELTNEDVELILRNMCSGLHITTDFNMNLGYNNTQGWYEK